MMLFGEKYGDEVRVLDIGSSRELCGGTHVARTGDIGLFKIVSESGVAAGVRRVEAVTGDNALHYLQSLESTLGRIAGELRSAPDEVPARVGQVLEHVRALEKELAALKGRLASAQGDDLAQRAVDVKGLKVLAARLDGADAKTLRDTLDKLKDKLKTAVVVLAAVDGGKVQIAAGVTADSDGARQGRRGGELRRRAGRRQGRRQGRHGDGRRQRSVAPCRGAGVGARLGRGARLMDMLFLEGLEVPCRVGCTDPERATPQSLRVEVKLYCPSLRDAALADDLERTVDYRLAGDLIDAVQGREFLLIERVAETLAEVVLKNPLIDHVTISVRKRPPVQGLEWAGVQITRGRGAAAPATS